MNRTVSTILPIALAVILPFLSLFSHPYFAGRLTEAFLKTWGITALAFYGLWHLLWHAWQKSVLYRTGWLLMGVGLLIGLHKSVLHIVHLELTTASFTMQPLVRIGLTLLLFSTIQYALRAQQSIARLELEKEQLRTENYRVQLRALRNQIEPHFLFNSLNTLSSLVRQQHKTSEQFIINLADFYRQTLHHKEQATVELRRELSVLRAYLFLMQSRGTDALFVKIDITEHWLAFHLPTLALQNVVENCFKHNSMTIQSPLRIEITVIDSGYLTITNNVQPKVDAVATSGHGLQLLRKRYDLLGETAGVDIHSTQERFQVQLKLLSQ